MIEVNPSTARGRKQVGVDTALAGVFWVVCRMWCVFCMCVCAFVSRTMSDVRVTCQVLDMIGEATQSKRLVLGKPLFAPSAVNPAAVVERSVSERDDGQRDGDDAEPAAGSGDGGDSGSPVVAPEPLKKKKGLSLILFEEVDVVFEQDKGFEAAVLHLMETAKCPIVLTCHGELAFPSARV